ncbi:hypothetical protein NIES4101_69650 [Calothrix sp. NIES-4101]|nr:hypothetical protein NIES4101_69650 [Calothrix sp. NIES-4101]
MNLMDILFLTLVSAAACIALPRLISMILALGGKPIQKHHVITLQNARQEVTSFPFCTTYSLTRTPACKFSPHFCGQCSHQ